MTYLEVSSIKNWHSHVYFDAESRDLAWQFRETVTKQVGDKEQIGRFHEKPVEPHSPMTRQELRLDNVRRLLTGSRSNHANGQR